MNWRVSATTARGVFTPVLAFLLLASAAAAQPTADDLFDPSVLRDIHLTMKADDWETLKDHYLEDTYYRADFEWSGTVVPIVGIRSRGSGSRDPHKPGLKIAFDEYLDQKPFGMKSLVLANGVQDPAMLKQRLGLLWFARAGLPSPRVVHVRLFVNRTYIGLYQLIEPIDKVFLARVYGTRDDGKPENGGYLYEYAWKDDYAWDYLGPELRIYAELFEPKTHESDAPAVLYGPLEEFFRTFNDVGGGQFEQEVSRYLDIPQFVRFLAVENFIADYDGFLGAWSVNNFYLYRFQGRTVSQILPWDKDLAFWDRTYDIFEGIEHNVLARRVLSTPKFYRLYLETLLGCAARAMERETPESRQGWFEAETAREIAQIHAAGYADENKRFQDWRFDDELEKVLRFARDRGPFVAREAGKRLAELNLHGIK